MKKLALGLALAAVTTCSLADWSPRYLGGQYTSTVTYGALGQTAQSVSSTEKMDASGNPAGPVGAFAAMALTLQPQLLADLNKASAKGVASGTTFQSGTLTGALQVYMAAPTFGATGANHVSMTGPTYKANYSSSGSVYGIGYTCTITATMANLQIGGAYYPASSQLDAAQTTITFTPQSNASCSTSIDWIPILGDWAARYANGKADSTTLGDLSAFEGRTLQSVLPGAPQFVGFNATIPNGVFMFNGQDMGQYIKNNAATLFSAPGSTLYMTIGAPQVEGPFVYGVSETAPSSYYNTDFSISFGSFAGSLSYKVSSERHYDYMWQCPRGVVRCMEP